jgi:hypothetical protein
LITGQKCQIYGASLNIPKKLRNDLLGDQTFSKIGGAETFYYNLRSGDVLLFGVKVFGSTVNGTGTMDTNVVIA